MPLFIQVKTDIQVHIRINEGWVTSYNLFIRYRGAVTQSKQVMAVEDIFCQSFTVWSMIFLLNASALAISTPHAPFFPIQNVCWEATAI